MQSQDNSSTGCFKSILKISIWGVIILMVICGLASSPQDHPYEKVAKVIRPEWNAINVLPDAKVLSQNSPAYRNKTVNVQAKYSTDIESKEVRAFYLDQAQKNGWTIIKDELVKATEKEPSEKVLLGFKKGEMNFWVTHSTFKDLDGVNLYVGMRQSLPSSK